MDINLLDFVFLIIMIYYLFDGFCKGFVQSAISFFLSIGVLYISYKFATIMGQQIVSLLCNYQPSLLKYTMIDSINTILGFAVLYIGLSMVKVVIYDLLKPLIRLIVKSFKITEYLDRIIGMLFSSLIGIFVCGVIIILCHFPIIQRGSSYVHESKVASAMIKVMPEVKDYIYELRYLNLYSSIDNHNFDKNSYLAVIDFIDLTYHYANLKDNEVVQVLNTYSSFVENTKGSLKLSKKELDKVNTVLTRPGVDPNIKRILLGKVNIDE